MTIIVTGGTRGIGLAIAKRLAKPGARLVLGYRSNEQTAARACATLAETGALVETFAADVGSIEAVARLSKPPGRSPT